MVIESIGIVSLHKNPILYRAVCMETRQILQSGKGALVASNVLAAMS